MPELKETDVFERCEHCKGTGGNPPKGEPPVLTKCGGGTGNAIVCTECKQQRGGEMTPTGEVIRDFLIWLWNTKQLRM